MSHRLPSLKPKEILRALKKAGFYIHHQTGGHVILKHPSDPSRRTVVPMHNRDLIRTTLMAIVKDTGMTPEEFARYL